MHHNYNEIFYLLKLCCHHPGDSLLFLCYNTPERSDADDCAILTLNLEN